MRPVYLQHDNQLIPYEVRHKSTVTRRIHLRTGPDGALVVIAPKRMGKRAIHKTLQVMTSLQTEAGQKLRLHFLPPYCPDHNRIERTWEDLHANVTRNHRRETMRELMKDVRGWLKKRNHHAKQHNSYQPL